MTHEYRSGDKAVVTIDRMSNHPYEPGVIVKAPNGAAYCLTMECLSPLPEPTPDPHAALKDAVVKAAMEWSIEWLPHDKVDALRSACDALRAAQQPPDPVRELRKVFDEGLKGSDWLQRMERAIAAMEAGRT